MENNQQKLATNENNKYNHNFSGRYCTCNKRYPPDENDTDAETNDEMWQCIVCEDWYHTKHLGAKELPTRFDELICTQCVDTLDFVHYYQHSDKPDVESTPGTTSPSKHLTATTECVLEKLKTIYHQHNKQESSTSTPTAEASKGPVFWQDCGWRSKLCRCEKCLEMYKVKGCEYLLDEKDTVQYYEAQGKALAKTNGSPFERGMSALNRMNRAAVVEALHGYNELKADLSDYLRKFADTKKVVREEDIHEFFQQLKSKKKPKLDY